jgi:aminomethyltransferase
MQTTDAPQHRSAADDNALGRLYLHDLHVAHGAKMTPFAGHEMPIQYAAGVLKEHLHTRAQAGLFDVSHMGQILISPLDHNMQTAALALEKLMPVDLLSLKPGRQRYAFFTTDNGGISDDLMIAHFGDFFLLVLNSARKGSDEELLRRHLTESCRVEPLNDRVLLALQGPSAAAVLAEIAPLTLPMRFMDVGIYEVDGAKCFISRSGYTGEDGFEISIPTDSAIRVVLHLLSNAAVQWVGLGARDSLRLEAGLCLYGSDIDTSTSPVEAALEWAIQASRRRAGQRAGGFPGEEVILDQLERGPPRRRVGLSAKDRPIRHGARLFAAENAGSPLGQVTSGGFGPSARAPIAMGYVPAAYSRAGVTLFAAVGERRIGVTVTPLPFIKHSYKR